MPFSKRRWLAADNTIGAETDRSPKEKRWIGEWVSIFLFKPIPVFLLKPLNPSCGVHEFLLPREEGMALGADLHMDLLLCALGFKGCSAGAFDNGIINLRVNILFHLPGLHIIYFTDFV